MRFSALHSGFLFKAARIAVCGCQAIAITAILGLFFVIAINIFMRALFDVTGAQVNLMIPGTIELASYALLIAVFAALPAGLENGMVRVDVLTGLMPEGVQTLLNRLWFFILFVFALALVWLFGEQVLVTRAHGEVSQDWGIPLWVIYLIICLECFAFSLVALAKFFNPVINNPELD